MDLSKIKKVHIIGIEGAGTSALARMLKSMGKEVSGSDEGDHYYFDMLKSEGIYVFHKFDKSNILPDVDLIVYSIAFKVSTNVELAQAFASGVKTITYGEALGMFFNQKYGIAVSGSHGKTTTTAWLGYVLEKSNKSPSVIVGAKVPQFNGNHLTGFSDYLVIEADEYGNKLQYFDPKIAILNNIDYDHPDFFPTKESYLQVFIDFIQRIPQGGVLLVNFDDKNIAKIANVNCKGRVVSYAIDSSADYVAYNIRQDGDKQIFNVKLGVNSFEDEEASDSNLGEFSTSLSGQHNVYNALAVISACVELEVDLVDVRTHLESFGGTARRMEVMGTYRGAIIVDDYAHHPTEIKTTLAGARKKYDNKKIITVFHPHTFTRTKALLDDFAQSFNDTNELIILDIYGSAREEQGGVHSKDLVKKINHKNVKYISTLQAVEEYLRDNIERGDVVLLMGAGDVFRIGENLVK